MRALAPVDTAVALNVAREMLRREEWRDIARTSALDALGRIRSDGSRALIVEHLSSGARPGRVAAINALVAHGAGSDTTVMRTLEPLLDDPDPFIRSAVAGALGRLGDRRALTVLEARRAVEQESRVRNALDQAIRRLGS